MYYQRTDTKIRPLINKFYLRYALWSASCLSVLRLATKDSPSLIFAPLTVTEPIERLSLFVDEVFLLSVPICSWSDERVLSIPANVDVDLALTTPIP